MLDLPTRKPNRLKNYDYSQNGVYYVTICTKKHAELFGCFCRGDRPGRPFMINTNTQETKGTHPYIELNEWGKCVDTSIRTVNNKNNAIKIQKYVIMPNHIHLIIAICSKTNAGRSKKRATESVAPTICGVVRNIKSYVSKKMGETVWQKSFHDHIIRDNDEYERIAEYIENNPAMMWEDDCYCCRKKRNSRW